MEPVFNGVKEFHCPYDQTAGSLGSERGNTITWNRCREAFHAYADLVRQREYFFWHSVNWGPNVAALVNHVENHLRLGDKSTFSYTQKPTVTYVRVSPWWVTQPMRHQFFTCCLRASLTFNRHKTRDWLNHLASYRYLGGTMPAVRRFLEGFTQYTGNITGWYRQFQNNPGDLNTLLVRPDQENISRIAYFKWLDAGQPHGRDQEFWAAAEAEYRR